jgi:thiol-disulfide isomerase/thioredoxin
MPKPVRVPGPDMESAQRGHHIWADHRIRRVVGALMAVAGLLFVTACGTTAQGQSQSRFVAGDGTITLLEPAERAPAPDVAGEFLDGEPFALRDYVGQVVALNVWASWCAPCRAEAPALNQIARETADQGVAFIGLDTRDSRASAEAFIRRFEVPYPSVWDPDATIQLAFRETLPPQAIPSTLFIDRQGRVAGRVLGEVDRTQLRDIVTELANEPSDQPNEPGVSATSSP